MTSIIHVVTVECSTEKAKELFSAVLQNLGNRYNLVHVANCEAIESVKHVITSLIIPPQVLITTSEWFEDEQEEVREIVKKYLPSLHLITIPPGLKTQEGDKAALEYLTDQFTELKLLTST